MALALSSSAMALAAGSALLAPLAASGGLWVARATDPALAQISAGLRPSSIVLASGLALGIALAASPTTLAGFAVCVCLAASAAADRDQYVLPDALTLAAVAIAFVFRPFTPTADRFALLYVGAGSYLLCTMFALFMRAWRGRAAFGQGDVKLIAALWLILPPALVLPAVLFGALCALACTCIPTRIATRAIPLGMHLVVGAGLAFGAGAAFPALLGPGDAVIPMVLGR
jgi:prepilin signal peptidase PulO-like enzyme (type II secretory pathway)